jgi:hypothetical protein
MKKGKMAGGFCLIWFILILLTIGGACWIVSTGGFANSKNFVIDGKTVTVEPYGLGNEDTKKNDSINYEIVTGNVVLSIIFSETIVVPVYLCLDYIYEPVSKKDVIRVIWTPSDFDTTHIGKKIIIKSTHK